VQPGDAPARLARYYLSVNNKKTAGDIVLSATRAIPILAPGANSPGGVTVAIPATTPPANYFLLVCADDVKKVPEGNEKNNCIASAAQVTVTP
jgi:hypothetical protein